MRSVHLTRGRAAAGEQPFSVDDAWVDVGAASAAEVEALGIGVLAPVALAKRPQRYGDGLLAAPAAGRRAACAALLAAASVQTGSGRQRGRRVRGADAAGGPPRRGGALGAARAVHRDPRSDRSPAVSARRRSRRCRSTRCARSPRISRSWIGEPPAAAAATPVTLPARVTPRRTHVQASYPATAEGRLAEAQDVVATLVERYGVSGAEGPVREAVAGMLPAWATSTTDSAGNLWVKVGTRRSAGRVRRPPGRDRLPRGLDPRRRDAGAVGTRRLLPVAVRGPGGAGATDRRATCRASSCRATRRWPRPTSRARCSVSVGAEIGGRGRRAGRRRRARRSRCPSGTRGSPAPAPPAAPSTTASARRAS